MSTSTITPGDAARSMWDVAVVGAGPAGSACAAACARDGARTLLLDRAVFPRDKVCGCCLSARGVELAESLLGAGAMRRLRAMTLSRLELRTARREANLRLAGGVALSRSLLDSALFENAINRGCAATMGVGARLRPAHSADHRVLALSTGDAVHARMVVVADGVAGHTLADEPGMAWRIATTSWMGAGCIAKASGCALDPGTVRMCCAASGYVGMVRLADGAVDIACALDPGASKLAGGPGALAARLVRATGAPWPESDLAWRGAPLLTRTRTPAGHRVLAIGDAAGYVEPFTGEGMTWALESALLAHPIALLGAGRWSPEVSAAWIHRHRAAIGRRQRACRSISALLRRQIALDMAMRVLARSPESGEMIARALHGRSEAA
ncbi:MAG: NAD(P)/FAD-dependent oxidoreductase [Phycisphaerales bacterium]